MSDKKTETKTVAKKVKKVTKAATKPATKTVAKKDAELEVSKDELKEEVHPITGLKVLRAESAASKAIKTPVKMNLVKPRAIETGEVNMANSSMLTFPTDRIGFTSGFKKEMIKAISRIQGDKAKYELFEEVVGILRKHAQAKFKAEQKG